MGIDMKYMLTNVFGPADPGGKRLKIMYGTFDFDSSYPTGGEAMDLSNEFKEVLWVLMTPNSGYVFQYDKAAKKILAYWYDYDATADGAAVEVTAATNMSAVVNVPFIAIGY